MKTTYLSFHFQMNLKERVISEFKMDFMKSCLNSGLNSTYSRPGGRGGGGTPIHYLYGYVPPKGVVILKLLIQKGVSISEVFPRTGYNISNAQKLSTFVSSHLEVFKDRLLLKTRFNALTSKPLYSCCTLERSIENWPISRTGY